MSVYTRIDHFKQSIAALQANGLAERSDLHVFSDAAGIAEDEDLVREVREFAHDISGFKKVHVTERETNYGGTKNSFLAYSEIIEKYGKSVYVEDDILCAPGFLTFMNEALEFYKDDGRIVSIAGYKPPFSMPKNYRDDVFVLGRVNGWGMGSFERTLEMARKKIDREEFESILNKKLFAANGVDILKMIEQELTGKIDAGDVRCMYHQALTNTLTVYPRRSLVENIGMDGTGVHCGTTNRFDIGKLWDKIERFEFVDNIEVDLRIQSENRKFRNDSLYQKIKRKLKAKF